MLHKQLVREEEQMEESSEQIQKGWRQRITFDSGQSRRPKVFSPNSLLASPLILSSFSPFPIRSKLDSPSKLDILPPSAFSHFWPFLAYLIKHLSWEKSCFMLHVSGLTPATHRQALWVTLYKLFLPLAWHKRNEIFIWCVLKGKRVLARKF